jgi:hypothetical protein
MVSYAQYTENSHSLYLLGLLGCVRAGWIFMRWFCPAAACSAVVLLVAGCGFTPPSTSSSNLPAAPPWFEDITESSGLHFIHDAGPFGRYFFPQVAGSGAALFDYDNDGRLDVYLLQNAGPDSSSTNRLFHQRPDGRFEDVSAGSGLDINGYNMGVAIGDVNNDGLPDVLVTQYMGIRLFLNNGDGTFTDVTRESGLDNPQWGTSAAFIDYDRDGWLDLVVTNYVDYDPTAPCIDNNGKPDFCPPASFPGSVTRLYHNLGCAVGSAHPHVRFQDVTVRSGLAKSPGPGLGVLCMDFDGDGWPDILVANDGKPNRLWINHHDGTFTEEGATRGVAYDGRGQAQANMGIAVGDINGDGLFDLFFTHLTWENHTLVMQGPGGSFQDRTGAAGLLRAGWRGTGFGTVLADFNQDGAPDLAIVNGRITRGPTDANPALGPWSSYAERNQLFANDGGGRFRDLSDSNAPFCGRPRVSRGLACGDVDGDGAIDLLVTTLGGQARLFRNVVPNRGHWLIVRALDPALKRDAYGARIKVTAGNKAYVGWVNPGYSYLCSNDPRPHFGLGKADRVEEIQVLWPDGVEESFPGRAADTLAVLRKGQGRPIAKP